MKNILSYALVLLLFIPFVAADVYMPALAQIYGLTGIILLLPIIFIESIVAYYVLKYNKIDVHFWNTTGMIAWANVLSSIIGFALSFIISIGSKNPTATIIMLYPAFILSTFVEFPILALFLRKKTDSPWTRSLQLSFLVNVVSYTLLLILLTLGAIF